MKKYETLTKYIPLLNGDYGEWVIDESHDGSPAQPIELGFVVYSKTVREFVGDVYAFINNNKDMGLFRYSEILEKNAVKPDSDVSYLDGACVMALVVRTVRADRFCEGTLLNAFQNGSVLRWLQRLLELDIG